MALQVSTPRGQLQMLNIKATWFEIAVHFCIIIGYAVVNYRSGKKNCRCLNIISKIVPCFKLYLLADNVSPLVAYEICGCPVGQT